MLGADDDPSGFEPRHPVLVDVHRRYPHWRLGRSDRLFEALVPSIVEQKVTGKEAFAGFRSLVHFHGERAPGPGREQKLWLQPTAEVRQRAHGDPDAVSFGDYHVAKDVGWALLGRRIDDDELAEVLEEWRPHRARVQAYVAMAGLGAPRRGPRMSLPTHYPSKLA
jgi:3-methyladenine DNA glycosylase/8-oxoguanine DNA glycosylase